MLFDLSVGSIINSAPISGLISLVLQGRAVGAFGVLIFGPAVEICHQECICFQSKFFAKFLVLRVFLTSSCQVP